MKVLCVMASNAFTVEALALSVRVRTCRDAGGNGSVVMILCSRLAWAVVTEAIEWAVIMVLWVMSCCDAVVTFIARNRLVVVRRT